MDIFLRSGNNPHYSLEVRDSNDPVKKDDLKIANIVVAKPNKSSKHQQDGVVIDNSLSLYVTSVEKKSMINSEYDVEDSKLFAMMCPTPDPNLKEKRQRDMLYVSGQSGSGKSTFVGQYCRNWQNSNNSKACFGGKIVLFSAVDNDIAFNDIKMKKIKFEDLVDEDGEPLDEIDIDDFEDSLTIFDDIDVIHNVKLKKWMQGLRNRILEIGRHKNISIICTTHQLMNYKETKILLMEATKVVIYPQSGAGEQIKRYLKTYLGLNKLEIQKIFQLKSRWVQLHKAVPRYVLHCNGAYFL